MRLLLAFIIAISAVAADEEDLPNLGVIGGSSAAPGQFPYQVSIEVNGYQHCGGTIISKNTVITAAHCMYKRNFAEMTVLAGTVNRILGGLAGTKLGIKKVTIHDKYGSTAVNAYDAAILELDGSFEFGPFLKAAQLPAEGEVLYANAIAVVSGWGSEYHQGATTTSLKYVNIPLWDRAYCLLYVPNLPESHLCAGDVTGQRNSCPGDSGGPLVSGGKLIGIVSGGFGCGAVLQPALYTYVSSIRPWIRQHAGF